jgi:pantoate--beta-alanine ligase
MLEVEMKFRVDDPDGLAAKLETWTAHLPRRDEDHYFNAPDRDFARTDEAFRVRTIGQQNLITYKGPKLDKVTKTRFEMELALPDGPVAAMEWRDLLTRLGYRRTGVVYKSRQPFSCQRDGFEVQATIDAVDDVGTYAELEIVATETDQERAKAVILQCAAELGLQEPERRSYLNLTLIKRNAKPSMVVIESLAELRRAISITRGSRATIGFVPTMGALHAGHVALIERARAQCDHVVVSIFVNPTQFGPSEDFNRYPRMVEADTKLCRKHGVDLVFVPDAAAIFPDDFATFIDVGAIGDVYEGATRPGHFRGVATVVLKLFHLVRPDAAYFGQKDAQQVAVIHQLVRDFNLPLQLVVVPTVREPDGLALSSRNRYLDPTQRTQAVVLSQALTAAKKAWADGQRDAKRLQDIMASVVAAAPDMRLDYAAVVDPKTFAPATANAIAIIAAKIGTTRLIDNMICRDETV